MPSEKRLSASVACALSLSKTPPVDRHRWITWYSPNSCSGSCASSWMKRSTRSCSAIRGNATSLSSITSVNRSWNREGTSQPEDGSKSIPIKRPSAPSARFRSSALRSTDEPSPSCTPASMISFGFKARTTQYQPARRPYNAVCFLCGSIRRVRFNSSRNAVSCSNSWMNAPADSTPIPSTKDINSESSSRFAMAYVKLSSSGSSNIKSSV